MINKNVFFNKFFKKNPNFPSDFLYTYFCNENEGYAFLCNYNEGSKVSLRDIQKIKSLSGDPDIVSKCCQIFEKNSDMLELVGDFIIKTGKMNPSADELISFLQNAGASKSKTTLGESNTIVAYKLTSDGELANDVSFKMTFLIEKFKNRRQFQKRLYIQEAESYDRGKGIYTEILNGFLPKLCVKNNISYIVLNASAHDKNSEKGGQENLEKFYKKLGYFRVKEGYDNELGVIKESDFDEGMPVYCKIIDREKEYDDYSM